MVKVGLVYGPEVVPANGPNIESRSLAKRLAGGGSTTLVGQLPSETMCPDPPANLFPYTGQHSPREARRGSFPRQTKADQFVSSPVPTFANGPVRPADVPRQLVANRGPRRPRSLPLVKKGPYLHTTARNAERRERVSMRL